MSKQRSVQGIVSGRVQGVFYRASLQQEARALALVGWVRNLADGSVEFVAQGGPEALAKLIRWAEHGPPHANVSAVEVKDIQTASDLRGFDIRY